MTDAELSRQEWIAEGETMIGQRYGMLRVIAASEPRVRIKKNGRPQVFRHWLCACDCGGKSTPREGSLKAGQTTSCGCKKREAARKAGAARRIHGMSKTKEAEAYSHMIARCYNPFSAQFKNYGQRGIAVCDRWYDSVATFLADMGPAPSAKHSLERLDVNGNYCPENWRMGNAERAAEESPEQSQDRVEGRDTGAC